MGSSLIDRFRGPCGIGVHSFSRVFERLGAYTMAGLASSIEGSRLLHLQSIQQLSDQLRRFGTVSAMTAVLAPMMASVDSSSIGSAALVSDVHYRIAINTGGSTQSEDIERHVGEIERERAACQTGYRRRSRGFISGTIFGDRGLREV